MFTPVKTKETKKMKRIVIFASGSGTNTQNCIQYFQQSTVAEVVHVFSNNKNAKVLERSRDLQVTATHFTKAELFSDEGVLSILNRIQPDLIVLAGFLWKFPETILAAFPDKVINIHPALLPKYGGKGMYGRHVHEAVVANSEKETGITIHYVNENYDEGAIILQQKIEVLPSDQPEDVAEKVHLLEYEWLPKVMAQLLKDEE